MATYNTDQNSFAYRGDMLTDKESQASGICQAPQSCRRHPSIHVAVLAALWHLLTGVERASVIPTLYLLLRNKWGNEIATSYYGVILSAFGMSVLLSTPIFGLASSYGIRVKILLYISNFLEIIGNLIYLTAYSPLVCFIGRFIAGFGAGCEPALYADIVRCTKPRERTPYIISLAVGKELGLFAGPILSILFYKVQFERPSFELNVYNAPGLFMAILWILHTVILSWYPIIDSNGDLVHMQIYPGENILEKLFFEKSIAESRKSEQNLLNKFTSRMSVFFTYPIVTMIVCLISGSFNSMCLEGLLPAVATRNYGWSVLEISYTYIGIFVILLISTVAMFYMSKYKDDRYLVITSFGTMGCAYTIMTVAMTLIGVTKTSTVINLSLLSVAIHAWSMPGVITVPDSLYSKITPINDTDLAQTIARFISNASLMMGLFIGGRFVTHPAIIALVMCIVGITPVILVLIKYDEFSAAHFALHDGIQLSDKA